MEIARQEIKTIQNTTIAPVASLKKEIKSETKMLIGKTDMNFRSGVTSIELTSHGEVILSEKCAQLLQVDIGSKIAYCPF
jgi:arginine/ornithine N-succinyltransferase beta subunit